MIEALVRFVGATVLGALFAVMTGALRPVPASPQEVTAILARTAADDGIRPDQLAAIDARHEAQIAALNARVGMIEAERLRARVPVLEVQQAIDIKRLDRIEYVGEGVLAIVFGQLALQLIGLRKKERA